MVFLFNYCYSLRERGAPQDNLGPETTSSGLTSLAYQTPLKKENTLHFSGCCQTVPSEGLGRAPQSGNRRAVCFVALSRTGKHKSKREQRRFTATFLCSGRIQTLFTPLLETCLAISMKKAFVCVLRVLCQFLSLGLGRSGK